jgi:hypothetical protein
MLVVFVAQNVEFNFFWDFHHGNGVEFNSICM